MEFNMSMVVPATPAELWSTLLDVSRISGCIPGCENVEEIERLATYKATVKQKIGPFKIEVPADIIVESITEPSHVRTRATGRDKFTGTRLAVVLDITVTPEESGSTFAVDAKVDVQGRLATMGFGVIKRRVDQNFEEFERRLKDLLGRDLIMLPLPFEFERPSTIADAVRAVGKSGDGMFYSGGTELLLAMKMRIIHTDRLVDIKGISGLDRIALTDANEIEIGARCTHSKIARDPVIREYVPVLSSLCDNVANVRVRSVGTIGGNLCFGEPHADPPTLLAALGARLLLDGSSGTRVVHADDFIQGELETAREPDELLTVITFPRPTGPVTYRRFKHGERPSVNVAMVWSLDAGGSKITSARVRVGALGSRPQLLKAVEDALQGISVADVRPAIAALLPTALDELEVNEDRHGSADYKRHLAGVLLLRNADEAIAASGGYEMSKALPISFSLNGRTIAIEVPVHMLLIDLIRDRLDLKGTKRSCDMEVCGACTVLLDGDPISSCTTLAVDVDQHEVTTIEGVTPPNCLSRIQTAFVLHGGLQCGFCTPGFIMAVTALLKTMPHPTDAEIRHYLHGNLCRCTGYTKIVDAVRSLAAAQVSEGDA